MSTKHCVLATTFCIFSACNIKVKSCKYFWFYRLCKELKENQKKVLEMFTTFFVFFVSSSSNFGFYLPHKKQKENPKKLFEFFFIFFIFFFYFFIFFFLHFDWYQESYYHSVGSRLCQPRVI